MTLDNLLLWLSAKGHGSWSQFRAAVERLRLQQASALDGSDDEGELLNTGGDLPLYQEARFAMQRLGHVEFYTKGAENGWRIVPPVAAFLVGAPAQALLCGARSPDLLCAIRSLGDIEVLESNIDGGPNRIFLRGPSPNVVADQVLSLGIRVQKAASTAILSALPSVRDPRGWYRESIPKTSGWTVHHFSESHFRWSDVSKTDAESACNGLFKFVMGYQRFYFLRWRGISYRVPVQVGKYAVVRRHRGILNYNADHRVLTVPAIGRPPLLIERALVLCSGQTPRYDPETRCLKYVEVPQEVARLAAQLLDQETL